MTFIRTVLKDIDPLDAGVVDTHEHLIRIGGGEVALEGEDYRMASVDAAVEECQRFLTFGGYRVKYFPDNVRADLIKEMIKAGYQKHITLATDSGKKSYLKAYGAGTGIDYDLSVFVPRLREEGVSEDAIQDILVNNPARLFAFDK